MKSVFLEDIAIFGYVFPTPTLLQGQTKFRMFLISAFIVSRLKASISLGCDKFVTSLRTANQSQSVAKHSHRFANLSQCRKLVAIVSQEFLHVKKITNSQSSRKFVANPSHSYLVLESTEKCVRVHENTMWCSYQAPQQMHAKIEVSKTAQDTKKSVKLPILINEKARCLCLEKSVIRPGRIPRLHNRRILPFKRNRDFLAEFLSFAHKSHRIFASGVELGLDLSRKISYFLNKRSRNFAPLSRNSVILVNAWTRIVKHS